MGDSTQGAAIPWIARTLTSEPQPRGIRVSAFAPDILAMVLSSACLSVRQVQHVSQQAKQQIPIGRIGRATRYRAGGPVLGVESVCI